MVNSMKDSGEIIKCMEKVISNGLMEEYTQVTTFKIKNMVLVLSNGPMEKSMKGTGDKVFKMDREKSEDLMVFRGRVSGKMGIG